MRCFSSNITTLWVGSMALFAMGGAANAWRRAQLAGIRAKASEESLQDAKADIPRMLAGGRRLFEMRKTFGLYEPPSTSPAGQSSTHQPAELNPPASNPSNPQCGS